MGLTGGIASGKSTVSGVFRKLGAFVIDADQIAHDLIRKEGMAYHAVLKAYGKEILDAQGEIDRKRLGEKVWGDPSEHARLNQLIHPHLFQKVWKEKEALCDQHPTQKGVCLFDAPLLIETGFHREVNRVVVVYVDRATQLERLMHRDALSYEGARRRIEAQMSLEEKVRFADDVIDNRKPADQVAQDVARLYLCLLDC